MASFSGKKEECGIFGIYSKKKQNATPCVYAALIALQHRGQDAAGMVLYSGKNLVSRRGLGLVGEIFSQDDLELKASIGIGHTRYPTTGRCLIQDVQPSVIDGISVSHNGHLANYSEIRAMLEKDGYIFTGTVDSEPIAYLLHQKISIGDSITKAVKYVMETLDGAYSETCIINGKLVVFRDPHAIRPLVWGESEEFVAFASESPALDANGMDYKGFVEGGELVIVDEKGMSRERLFTKETRNCMFEYVYFSRPDSCINDHHVFEVREALGVQLAAEHPASADLVVPVPDTSRNAAESYSRATGIPFKEGLIKNRYIGRTFIMPSQEKRSTAVRMKLNAVKHLLSGKRVVLIDDSIVRGTTMREIVSLIRRAGAKEVHLRITCPPIKGPCFYGVDLPNYAQLIAHKKSVEEIRKFLGADSLGYLSIKGLQKAIGYTDLCMGCLNEVYVTKAARDAAKNSLTDSKAPSSSCAGKKD